MIDQPNPIAVEASEADWNSLLKRVREQGGPVRILDHGIPVAELTSLSKPRQQATDPNLKVTFAPDYDPTASVDESDWPEQQR